MKSLVIYGTVEGQTGKIAHFVADHLTAAGHQAKLVNADEPDEIPFDDADAVILAACVHQRRHPRGFEALLTAHAEELKAAKCLFLSVSLNAAFPEGHEEAREYVTEMQMRTGFEPDDDMLVGGAVRTTHYDYFAMQVIRHVVMRDRPFDASASEHEFTDWDAVAAKVDSFLA